MPESSIFSSLERANSARFGVSRQVSSRSFIRECARRSETRCSLRRSSSLRQQPAAWSHFASLLSGHAGFLARHAPHVHQAQNRGAEQCFFILFSFTNRLSERPSDSVGQLFRRLEVGVLRRVQRGGDDALCVPRQKHAGYVVSSRDQRVARDRRRSLQVRSDRLV